MLASTMLFELFTTKIPAALTTLTHTRKSCLMVINSCMELASAFHGVMTQITWPGNQDRSRSWPSLVNLARRTTDKPHYNLDGLASSGFSGGQLTSLLLCDSG